MCYFAIRMLIPSVARVSSFSFNTIALGFLLLFMLPSLVKMYKRSGGQVHKYIKALVFIFLGLFILTFLGEIPLMFQWSALIQTFVTEFVPSILLAIYLTRYKDYKTFCNIICVIALIASLYGIYTYVYADNPIYMMFNTSGEEGYDLEEYATGRLGLTGIAVGIYNDKIALSLISLLLLMFLITKTCVNKVLLSTTLLLVFVSMFLTTQRTALFALFLFFIIMFFDKKDKIVKRYLKLSVILLIVITIVSDSDIIRDAFYSLIFIFDDNAQQRLGIGGSSTDMRTLQFLNGFMYLGWDKLLQGAGYNFAEYYYSYIFRRDLYGMDMRFFGFESFLLKTLMGSGIIGIVVWFVGIFKIFKILSPQKAVYDIAFLVAYFIAIAMTDTSASFYLFFFFMVLNSKRYLLLQKREDDLRSKCICNC